MKITGDWIQAEPLQAVMACLSNGGHQVFLVGGCVRNALMGLMVNDIDIATDALPERVIALAKPAGLKVVPTGFEHGTVTVIAGGQPHEVTTFRRDVETDGRRARVAFSTSIEDDAARRDFTMNALYADATGQVSDPLGGLPDVLAGRVRFVGQAEARIREDYLRILRFFRFHAIYGDPAVGIDSEGLAACAANCTAIETLSRERIGHEMRRLLGAADPAPAVAAMQATGVLANALPGADARALGPLVHLEGTRAPDWLRRLAAIGGDAPAQALRLSRSETLALEVLRSGIGSSAGVGELAYRHGAQAADSILLLRHVMLETPPAPGFAAAIAKGAAAKFPLRAADLDGRFVGPALGQALREREARWIASGFELSREQLLA